MTVIAIPKILRERLTDEGAEALVEVLNEVEIRSKDRTMEVTEEKFEKRLAEVGADIRNNLTETRANLEVKIAQTETRIIRWMFIFWAGQIGILFAFFRK